MSGLLHSCTPKLLQMNAIMKKKAYIKPSAEVTDMEPVAIIAASIGIDSDHEGGYEQLSNGRRGTWGNLWADNEKE